MHGMASMHMDVIHLARKMDMMHMDVVHSILMVDEAHGALAEPQVVQQAQCQALQRNDGTAKVQSTLAVLLHPQYEDLQQL